MKLLSPVCSVLILLFAGYHSVAQSDSTLHYYTGDGGEQEFNLSEIRVRNKCKCTGSCCCSKKQESNYSGNRFIATDALLSKNPSIELIRRGSFALEPVMNGMSSDRMNMTIDGMKIFGACTDKMDPITSYVEPNNMKSVSVMQGSAGSMFGSSIAGTLNMETRGATIRESERIRGEVGTGFQSAANGMNHLYALNYSKSKWAILSNGVYRKFHNFRAGGGERISFTQFEKWNNSFSAKFMPQKQSILRFDLILDEGYNIGYAALPMDVLYAKAKIGGLSFEHYFKDRLFEKMELKVYANKVEHAMDDTHRPNVAIHMDMPGLTETVGTYADFRYKKSVHNGLIRLDAYRTRARAEMTMYPVEELPMFMLTWPDVVKQSTGLYAKDEWTLKNGNRVGVNGRIDYLNTISRDALGIAQAEIFQQNIGTHNHRWLKNFGLNYTGKYGKHSKYWATAGYVERAPGTTEQYAFYIFNAFDGFDYLGDVNVANERAWQSDFGGEWSKGRITWVLSGFYYRISDYIMGIVDPDMDAMTIGARGVKVTGNIPVAVLKGARSGFSYKLTKGFDLNNRTSWTHGETGSGMPLPMIAPVRNVLSGRWTYKSGFMQLETEAVASQNRVSTDFGEQTTASYFLVHLRGGHAFKAGKNQLVLNGGIENLLDRRYRTHLTWGGIPQPGMNAFLNLNYTF